MIVNIIDLGGAYDELLKIYHMALRYELDKLLRLNN